MKFQPDFNTHRLSSRQVCEETEEQTVGLSSKEMSRNTQLRCFQSSAAPATQNEEVFQVLRLPRKKGGGNQSSPDFRGPV